MIKSLTTAATGMQAQQTNMDVIANNMANVSTTGFKKSRAEFEDLMYQNIKDPGAASGLNAVSPTGVQVGLGVKTGATQKDFEIGSAKMTKNPFDLNIEGNGFFKVKLSDGQIGYTRDGSFKKSPDGRIVDRNGNAMQPEIVVPPNSTAIDISPQGQVSVLVGNSREPQNIGQLELANFVNPAGLNSLGKNVYVPSPSSGLPQSAQPGQQGMGQVAQGELESSNVNIVDEMVGMITAQRAYETNSKVIQASDQMLQYINQMR